MSTIRPTRHHTTTSGAPIEIGPLSAETRIDAPHRLAAPAEGLPASNAAGNASQPPSPSLYELNNEQLQRHAQQLAAQLEARQAELDRREAELDRQQAELAQQQHEAQLWWHDRLRELTEAGTAASTAPQGQGQQPSADNRQHELAAREQALAHDFAAFDACWQEFVSTRQRWEQAWLAEQQRQAVLVQQQQAELERREQALEAWTERLDARQAWLEQLHDQLAALQTETLEARLAYESLETKLLKQVGGNTAHRQGAHHRAQLQQQYEQTVARQAEQRAELLAIRQQLSDDYQRLEQLRREAHQALGDQARQLAEREAALAKREAAVGGQWEQCQQLQLKLLAEQLQWRRQHCQRAAAPDNR